MLAQLREQFFSSEKNRLALNVCSRYFYPPALYCSFSTETWLRSDPLEACLQRSCLENTVHIYNHKVGHLLHSVSLVNFMLDVQVEVEGKPVTNQKSSGR